jgi:hypothetical protein
MRSKIASVIAVSLMAALAIVIAPDQAWALICTFDVGTAANSGTDGGVDTNTVCGQDADASGAGSTNSAYGSNANASGDGSFNTATGAAANASGGNSVKHRRRNE